MRVFFKVRMSSGAPGNAEYREAGIVFFRK